MTTCLDMFAETRNSLKKRGLPFGDQIVKRDNFSEFSAGGHYGIEISSMNNLKTIEMTFDLAEKYKLPISRVIECRGICRLPDAEIAAIVALCASRRVGLIMSVGPRAISDIGAFVASPNGKRVGYRLRGMENVIHALEDVKRGLQLGVRGFTIYDEGLLTLLNEMRNDGEMPRDMILKFSVHSGCSNPMSAMLLERIGADTINVIPDLDVAMIASFRPLIKGPIDVFSDTAKSAGGFLRTYDMPKVIAVASPIYLKCGPISQPEQNHLPSTSELEERVKQAVNVFEHVQRYIPQAKLVSDTEKTLAVPSGV